MLYLFLLIASLMPMSQAACFSSQFSAGGVCQPCNLLCLTCSGSSSSDCESCVSTRTWDSFAKTCNCKDGYKEYSPMQANCQQMACHVSCLTCNNTEAFCTSCASNSFRSLVSGLGECRCNSKYFEAGSAACSACHYTCQ